MAKPSPTCPTGDAGLVLLDVTDPANPLSLGRTPRLEIVGETSPLVERNLYDADMNERECVNG